jgi:REP element-mobilizing transposase RayT
MGRHQRDFSSSEWQHICNRGADKQDLYSADGDQVLFEDLAAEAFGRFEISLHAYVLMTNHFHFLLHAPMEGVSEAMQRLCGRYGSAYNHRTERTGSLFTGRFRSVPITSDAQLMWAGRYIHRNPLGMIGPQALAAYRWSSLGALLGKRAAPSWLVTDTLLADWPTPDRYLEYVLEPQPSDRLAHGALRPLVATSCDDIDHAVRAVVSATDPAFFDRGSRVSDVARTLSVMLAMEMRAATAEQLAARHSLSEPSSARRLARRGRVLVAQSTRFAQLRDGVLDTLHGSISMPGAA